MSLRQFLELPEPTYDPKDADEYGTPISGSRWYRGDLIVKDGRWLCPLDGGEMVNTRGRWLTGDPGLHHVCNKCGFMAAVHRHQLERAGVAD